MFTGAMKAFPVPRLQAGFINQSFTLQCNNTLRRMRVRLRNPQNNVISQVLRNVSIRHDGLYTCIFTDIDFNSVVYSTKFTFVVMGRKVI